MCVSVYVCLQVYKCICTCIGVWRPKLTVCVLLGNFCSEAGSLSQPGIHSFSYSDYPACSGIQACVASTLPTE